jgi:hypothetical protein
MPGQSEPAPRSPPLFIHPSIHPKHQVIGWWAPGCLPDGWMDGWWSPCCLLSEWMDGGWMVVSLLLVE